MILRRSQHLREPDHYRVQHLEHSISLYYYLSDQGCFHVPQTSIDYLHEKICFLSPLALSEILLDKYCLLLLITVI
jgi:hypothetical protein